MWLQRAYKGLIGQGWCSGESAHLPPMWPGFESWLPRHMWVEFVVGSLPCSERLFPGYSCFPLPLQTNTFKFQFDLERMDTFFIWTPIFNICASGTSNLYAITKLYIHEGVYEPARTSADQFTTAKTAWRPMRDFSHEIFVLSLTVLGSIYRKSSIYVSSLIKS